MSTNIKKSQNKNKRVSIKSKKKDLVINLKKGISNHPFNESKVHISLPKEKLEEVIANADLANDEPHSILEIDEKSGEAQVALMSIDIVAAAISVAFMIQVYLKV